MSRLRRRRCPAQIQSTEQVEQVRIGRKGAWCCHYGGALDVAGRRRESLIKIVQSSQQVQQGILSKNK